MPFTKYYPACRYCRRDAMRLNLDKSPWLDAPWRIHDLWMARRPVTLQSCLYCPPPRCETGRRVWEPFRICMVSSDGTLHTGHYVWRWQPASDFEMLLHGISVPIEVRFDEIPWAAA